MLCKALLFITELQHTNTPILDIYIDIWRFIYILRRTTSQRFSEKVHMQHSYMICAKRGFACTPHDLVISLCRSIWFVYYIVCRTTSQVRWIILNRPTLCVCVFWLRPMATYNLLLPAGGYCFCLRYNLKSVNPSESLHVLSQ